MDYGGWGRCNFSNPSLFSFFYFFLYHSLRSHLNLDIFFWQVCFCLSCLILWKEKNLCSMPDRCQYTVWASLNCHACYRSWQGWPGYWLTPLPCVHKQRGKSKTTFVLSISIASAHGEYHGFLWLMMPTPDIQYRFHAKQAEKHIFYLKICFCIIHTFLLLWFLSCKKLWHVFH